MLEQMLRRLKNWPGLLKRAFAKLIVGPLRYGRGGGYDAARYWDERFRKYGRCIKGPGDEGLSQQENERAYAEAGRVFRELIRAEGLDLTGLRVLEIGPGTGFYTEILRDLGARNLTGIDITDAMFDDLRARMPGFEFVAGDVAAGAIEGQYDLVVMIDVIEHIVEGRRLAAAMDNLRRCMAPGGRLLIAPLAARSRKYLFYVHTWTLEDVRAHFADCTIGRPVPFRAGHVVVIRAPEAS